jgi:hypothetical protein
VSASGPGGLLRVNSPYVAGVTDLIVLSGSVATAWGAAPGWGAVVYLPGSGEIRKIVDPAFDPKMAGSDVLPLAAAIQWYHYARRPKGHRPRVDVATDSLELIISAGDPLRWSDGSDWRFMHWFESMGYTIRWVFLGEPDDDCDSGVRRELAEYSARCQSAFASRLLRR